MRKLSKNLKNSLIILAAFVAILAVLSVYRMPGTEIRDVSFDALVERIQAGEVESIEVSGDEVTATLDDGTVERAMKEGSESLASQLTAFGVTQEQLRESGIEIKGEGGASFFLTSVLPFLLPILLIVGFIYLMMRQVQGANARAMMFGQSSAREILPSDGKDRITFKDVAGAKTAKEELAEVVEFLKHPKKFSDIGAKIPKGVLLMGAPGTGKTLLARAVSGEAGVPFFTISGSEFVEMFVGVGASRVRDLFKKALKNAPCIIFIDEIDAVGRQRGAGLGGSHDEREQTLNQILVEMDGFETNSGVIVMAATNRPDVLDPALLRPGRFDRRVVLDMPDIDDRHKILKVHAKGKPLADDIRLRTIAERTAGFSGADLANLVNEAAILTVRRAKKRVGMDEFIESIEKVLLGPARKGVLMSEKEKRITAYHEAGHALVAHMIPEADPVHKVSIVSRGAAAGYTLKMPDEDKHLHSLNDFLADIAVGLAGHVTEKAMFEQVTTGSSNDLRHATDLARKLVTEYGMSEKMGPRTFGDREEMVFLGRDIREQRNYSENIAEEIDREVSRIISNAYDRATEIITAHRDKLEEIASMLLEKETIERPEFEAIFRKKSSDK